MLSISLEKNVLKTLLSINGSESNCLEKAKVNREPPVFSWKLPYILIQILNSIKLFPFYVGRGSLTGRYGITENGKCIFSLLYVGFVLIINWHPCHFWKGPWVLFKNATLISNVAAWLCCLVHPAGQWRILYV